jgi:hypothetical protein
MNGKDGNMNTVLRRVAFVMGLILLLISIYWSQDGFNFNIAGDSGGTDMAIFVGYTIAVAVTVVQFVFSTNLRELNASLLVFGLIAYAYSIYTNYQGILHFQGTQPNNIMAWILGFAMDGVPEPLMAWGLRESLSGDFVGNLFKGVGAFVTGKPIGGSQSKGDHQPQRSQQSQPKHNHQGGSNKQKGSDRRMELEKMYMRRSEDGGGAREKHFEQGGNHKNREI